jgi:Protein of unknown function (DUF3108)
MGHGTAVAGEKQIPCGDDKQEKDDKQESNSQSNCTSEWAKAEGGELRRSTSVGVWVRRLALCGWGMVAFVGVGRAQLLGLGSKPAAPVVIPTLQAPVAGYVFPARQTLTYAVDWRVFQAGTAVFHLEQQGDLLKVGATADTLGAVNMLFPVVDRFQAGLDTKTGCSSGFAKQLQEGRRKVSSDLKFDYNAGKQTQVEKNLVKGTEKTQTASIPACVTDSLSAIFYAASQRLVVGQDVRFPLADSMRTVTVAMKVEAKEEVRTPAGTFQTVRVQPTAEEGIVKSRGNIWIWYTDDARHMPVQMRARLFWGTITFHLQSVEAK